MRPGTVDRGINGRKSTCSIVAAVEFEALCHKEAGCLRYRFDFFNVATQPRRAVVWRFYQHTRVAPSSVAGVCKAGVGQQNVWCDDAIDRLRRQVRVVRPRKCGEYVRAYTNEAPKLVIFPGKCSVAAGPLFCPGRPAL